MNIVIMAGGGGTRLWPLSLNENPKQFVDLGTGKTLLEMAYDRAIQVTDIDHIYVATAQQYVGRIKEILPKIDSKKIFAEPSRRDTTAAFAQVCLRLQAEGKGDEPTTFLWSDHIFTREEKFIADLKLIPKVLETNPESLVIIGHTPLSANTTLGYFKAGEKIEGFENAYKVEEFKEKPDKEKAEEYVADGSYFWNLGYFSLKPNYLLAELVSATESLAEPLEKLKQAIIANVQGDITKRYNDFPKIALEFTFVEKTKTILAITGDYGWSDIGSWGTVKEVFGIAGDHMPAGHHTHVDSENNYIYNTTDKAVSLIGVKNSIIVVTDKAVLVTNEDSAHKVKEVVQKLEEENQQNYL